jgi:hypothetical protein
VNNAAVSGQVPITLVSGISLVSGTLTYFPATNPQAVVTLNASTTGSGQIGTFDATLLASGGYFILLNGTNSQNVTQTSQVYVTSPRRECASRSSGPTTAWCAAHPATSAMGGHSASISRRK